LLANVYLEWDITEHYDKAINATDLANAVRYTVHAVANAS